MNKRYLAPAIAGVVVFGAVTAFAAGFNVTSNTVVSGNATVTGCNATAKVGYTTQWDPAFMLGGVLTPSYVVKLAPVTTAAACKNMDYRVTLQDSSQKSLGELTGTLDPTGAASPDFWTSSPHILASDVTAISITVTG